MNNVRTFRRFLCIPLLLLSGLFLTLGFIIGKWAVVIAEGRETANEWVMDN